MNNTFVLMGFGIFGLIALLYMVFIQNKKPTQSTVDEDDSIDLDQTSYDAESEIHSN